MSKQEEAGLILKLYELRREDTMRKARDWFGMQFHPQSFADFKTAIMGEHSGKLRMVTSYWDMAAALVNQGAISQEMFTNTNGEHIGVFARVEPFLSEIRAWLGPQFLRNLEQLIDATPDGRQLVARNREMMKAVVAELREQQAKAAQR